MFLRLVLMLGLMVLTTPALAAPAPTKSPGAKSLGTFGAWGTYSLTEKDQHVCYMAARVPVAKGSKLKRGPVQITITHRPAESSKDVFSYDAGYAFKDGSDVIIRVGKYDFNLFTQKDTAWTRDTRTDHLLAAAVQKNAHMTVIGNPAAKGAKTITDTIDLRGASDAYRMISKTCGIQLPAEPKPVKAIPAKKAAPAPKKKVK